MKENSPRKIHVAIIEDNRFIRDGLKLVLEAEKDFELIGSYPSCEDAFYFDDIGRAQIVVMDIQLPGISGIEGIKYLKKHFPELLIIVCTAYEDDENVFNAIAAGASGFISKKASPQELIKTIIVVNKGGSPITPNVAVKINLFLKKQEIKLSSNLLTKIESKVLEKISIGKSYSTVAKELNKTEKEILFQIRSIYGKLHDNLIQIIH